MKKFIFLFVLPASVLFLFLSGAAPYTLVYDAASLQRLDYEGKNPITADVVTCKVQDTKGLHMGSEMTTDFRVKLINHTDRFVLISAIGEVFAPTGQSAGMHSKMFMLNPNADENTEFRSKTTFVRGGRYKCQVRYVIGRFKY